MAWIKFIICLFFGYLGIHKFMEKKIGMGIIYLFTIQKDHRTGYRRT